MISPAPWLPARGATYFPCNCPNLTYTVGPATSNEPRVPTRCGHDAWAREHISIQGGLVVQKLVHSERIPANRQAPPGLFGLTWSASPAPSPQPIPYCTICQLGNNLKNAVLCARCKRLIFPGSFAWLAEDTAHNLEGIPVTKFMWDRRVIVCNHEPCRSQAQAQVFGKTLIVHGKWSHRNALVVDPR
jgi:hypothetical protein